MKEELQLVKEFHEKFKALVSESPTLIAEDLSRNRHDLMNAEVAEYLEGVQDNDLENIAKELADILYATYGTIIEHGLQDKMPEIFAEVHRSNMSKDYGPYKMVKGPDYSPADVSAIIDQ